MTISLFVLRLHQLDASLKRWRESELPARPSTGWIRAIRDALGMSSGALARRVGVSDSAIRKLEHAEAEDAISLSTLRHIAAAMDCELQYALVPRQPLGEMRKQRAEAVARDQVQTVARSMALEDQNASSALIEAQVNELAQSLLAKSGRGLW